MLLVQISKPRETDAASSTCNRLALITSSLEALGLKFVIRICGNSSDAIQGSGGGSLAVPGAEMSPLLRVTAVSGPGHGRTPFQPLLVPVRLRSLSTNSGSYLISVQCIICLFVAASFYSLQHASWLFHTQISESSICWSLKGTRKTDSDLINDHSPRTAFTFSSVLVLSH